MGQEIDTTNFSSSNFNIFESRLQKETKLLEKWFNQNSISKTDLKSGYELEAWLINKQFNPAPINNRFLNLADDPMLSPELACFNIELNCTPQPLQNFCFSKAQKELEKRLQSCLNLAENLDANIGLFGILPTLQPDDLTIEHISSSKRFAALNEQVLAQRKGKPLKIEINGEEHLRLEHKNVMLESATTSFQVHFQVPASQSARYYNASLLASAATVALAANSPFLFGKKLWAETRIPLFEQAVEVGGYADAVAGPLKRVSFGTHYLNQSVLECFQENLRHFPILLPILLNKNIESMEHLRFHNGTIWRWNRPLIDFDAENNPHIRLEHRVMPAGPSIVDMLANAAFYYGLCQSLTHSTKPYEQQIDFATAKNNFYKAAQLGLDAKTKWTNEKIFSLRKLLLNTLLPMAHEGLTELNIDGNDIEFYLNIIKERIKNNQTGANWQIEFMRRTGHDMRLLTEAYLRRQQSNQPVHTWQLPVLPQKTQDPKLTILSAVPEGFLEIDAKSLYKIIPGPTLIILPGQRTKEGIFVSILLHGNETSGLNVMQQLLKKYRKKTLPRNLYIFIGNVDAARYGLRHLAGQTDFNRVWPGSTLPPCAESKLIAQVYNYLIDKNIIFSVDLHNNTGLNPHYACVNKLDNAFLHLALLFSRTVVYFIRPTGIQAQALANLCPAVTIECGKAGDQIGIDRAQNFIEVCMTLESISDQPIKNKDIDLFHTFAQVKINDSLRISFDDEPADVNFNHDLEYMNFRELTPGTPLGECVQLDNEPLEVLDEQGKNIYADYFTVDNGLLRIKKTIMPSMLTTDEKVIKQDCFCYLMQRIQAPALIPIEYRSIKKLLHILIQKITTLFQK